MASLKGIKVTDNGNYVSKHKLIIFLFQYLFKFEIYRQNNDNVFDVCNLCGNKIYDKNDTKAK